MSVLEPFSNTWIPLFLLSMVVTSVLEYITSWVLEKLFDTKWWDYSHYKFQIKGRVCLLNSTLFGLLGMLASHFVHPVLMKLVMMIKEPVVIYIASGLAVVFTVDFAFTIRKLINFNTYLAKLEEFSETLKTRFVNEVWFTSCLSFDEVLKELKDQTKQKSDEMTALILQRLELFSKSQKKNIALIKAFPTMTSRRYKEQIEQLKTTVKKTMHRHGKSK